MSNADQNWPRDRFGVDMNRFVWHGQPRAEGGVDARVSFVQVTITSDQNDFNPTVNQVTFGANSVVIATPTQNVAITGMVPYVGGEIKTIVNTDTSGLIFITCSNNSGASQPTNRFYIGSDIVIAPGNSATFWYNPITLQWNLFSLRGGVQSALPLMMNGGSSPLSTGIVGWLVIPSDCVITGWELSSTETATMTVDVWKTAFANFPPTGANSITGGNPPMLVGQKLNSDTVLAGWTRNISRRDVIMYNINSTNGNAIRAMISLDVTRTQ